MSSKKVEDGKPRENPKVYVVGGGMEYIRLMYRLGCDGAKGLEDADVVLFTGGEDVNPELYGEIPMARTNFNRIRDMKEQLIYQAALDREIPMVGICRGGQFLNVMNGGKMWQHVTGHTAPHVARIEVAPLLKGNKRRTIEVTSTHHQMMIPAKHGMTLLTAMEAYEKLAPAYSKIGKDNKEPDTEAVYYDDTHCLCFQPHPEFRSASPDCVDFFEECMDNFIYPNIPIKGGKPVEKTVPKTKAAAASKKEKK
jgi:gamma-glutamyl-gamma-aminobutyrate hydrolase PuuD